MNAKVSFQNVSRRKLVDEVVMQLQKKISSGDIPPGQKIPTEPELMEQFGVGRSTVREAVRVLVHAGLLEKKQGFGTYLSTNLTIQEPLDHRLRRAEILEVYEVRRMLELEIAKLAAERRDDDDLAQMRQFLDQRAQALKIGPNNDYLNADISFHIAVAAASKNSIVIDLYRTFSTVLREALDKLVQVSTVHDSHDLHHENLYDAIKKKDAAAAVHWTLQNLEETVSSMKKSLNAADDN
ncbi:FadR/GntR family transcriptional regulator [Paenibacillus radicis (ex Xue et al. 2023)]|uniref:FadR family transcriptional regulator n=1 Tax=Paenibacillus radicis (ex Xue et al. 2023) TaxID=2972489 RepID=A0ABT1YHI1_9BACL|nr:FadR/GntR family transcriptional regulator [Paenibacillus radicis (ex Xue et al. 2023)]MCR8632656.1 FadR family transcriptional regulator [Paenibacillus radicis (ex Xue et al. 2023)]